MLADTKEPVETKVEEKVEAPVEQKVNDKVDVDIDLGVTRKKRLRIDGDNSRIVELDLSDMGILSRLTDAYPKLEKLQAKAMKISEDVTEGGEEYDEVKLGKDLKSIDKDMRNILDTIFDSNVSEVCAPSGTMFDPFQGGFRYEYIINALVKAYDDNISSEVEKINKPGIEKHTKKYKGK